MKPLLVLLLVAAPPRDPEYDKLLAAYKAKKWAQFDALSEKFLKEKPDYKFAHSVRFMRADSFFHRERYKDAEYACRLYLRLHKGAALERRVRGLLVLGLNEQARYQDALDAGAGGYEKAVALEGLRRFEEAAKELEALPYRAQVAFRLGVVRFRQRRFDLAKKQLSECVRQWPKSRYVARAKAYLLRIDPAYRRIEKGVVLDYHGKYKDDPRLARVLDGLPRLRSLALTYIRDLLGRRIPDTFLVRLSDSGDDQSGLWAQVRTERVQGKPRSVLVLSTEHLVLGTHDLSKTLVHELYHCVQRELLGEDGHLNTPKWMREGVALFVASQADDRCRVLAEYVGGRQRRSRQPDDPLGDLVDGLTGRHTLEDYGEDVAAFLAVEKRHGKAKTVALLNRLLETPDVRVAIQEVLGEPFGTFQRHAAGHARSLLEPLVTNGCAALLAIRAKARSKDYEELLGLPAPGGAYAQLAAYYRALALHGLGRNKEALPAVRGVDLRRTSRTGSVKLLELRILKALNHADFAEASRRARLDLEPFYVYPMVLKLLDD